MTMKKIFKYFLVIVPAIVAGMISCTKGTDGPVPEPPEENDGLYSITFSESAYGSAVASIDGLKISEAYEGEEVTIEAAVDSSYSGTHEFSCWKVISGDAVISDTASATAVLTMPGEDVELEAVFSEIRIPSVHNIILDTEGVTGGTFGAYIDGEKAASAATGTEVELAAIPSSPAVGDIYEFVEWQLTGAEPADKYSSTTVFVMPDEDVTVKAVFRLDDDLVYYDIECIQTSGGTITAYIGQEKVDKAMAGQNILVMAVPDEGYVWSHWECSDNVNFDDSSVCDPGTFKMPGEDVVLKAVFEEKTYVITLMTVTSGPLSGSKAEAFFEGQKVNRAKPGQRIDLVATPGPSVASQIEEMFIEWTSEPSPLLFTTTTPETAFIMPEGDVVITCWFDDKIPTGNPVGDSRFYGTWVDEATGTKIIISEDRFDFVRISDNKGYSLENLHWNPVKNEGEFASHSMAENYPDGYRIEAVSMDRYFGDGDPYTGIYPWREDGTVYAYPNGIDVAFEWWYISEDGTSLMPGRNPTDASGGKGPYVKQE